MSVWDTGETPYRSERDWAEAEVRRLRWAAVCRTRLGSNLAIAGALTAAAHDAQQRCTVLERELADLRAQVVAAMSSAGPEVAEDKRTS